MNNVNQARDVGLQKCIEDWQRSRRGRRPVCPTEQSSVNFPGSSQRLKVAGKFNVVLDFGWRTWFWVAKLILGTRGILVAQLILGGAAVHRCDNRLILSTGFSHRDRALSTSTRIFQQPPETR
jgi:hypothetical protein